jgi:hypothetical protein
MHTLLARIEPTRGRERARLRRNHGDIHRRRGGVKGHTNVYPRCPAYETQSLRASFWSQCAGYSDAVQHSEEFPDDVPVADAVEQQRTFSEPVPDEEASAEPPDDMPLETAPADWQEQLQTVELDPDYDEVDRP